MTFKDRWRVIRPKVLAGLAYGLVRTLGSMVRLKVVGSEKLEKLDKGILCGWHGRSLIFANHYRNRGVWVIISHSKDGDLQASIFGRLGYRIIRGSTGRGGIRAAVEGIRALRQGGVMAFTPDGPRGPSHVVQGGAMTMAQKSGAPLVPVGISAKHRFLFKSWDRYMIPFPFSKAIIILGDPWHVSASAGEEEVESMRLRFEEELNRLEVVAEQAMGHSI